MNIMVPLAQKVVSEVLNEVLKLVQDDIYKVVLYGSYARGDFDQESDIDILIVLNCDIRKMKEYRKHVSRIASRIGLENDVEVSLLLRDKQTVDVGEKILPFYQNVMKDGVTLYE